MIYLNPAMICYFSVNGKKVDIRTPNDTALPLEFPTEAAAKDWCDKNAKAIQGCITIPHDKKY